MSTIDKIIQLLASQNRSQKDLTDYLGIDKSTFSQWKNGKSQSYNKYISQIAVFLGTTPSDLLNWETSSLSTGDRIRLIREAKGLSQEDLARLTGYPVSSIKKYESDERQPSEPVRLKLKQALELDQWDDTIPRIPGIFDFRDDIELEIEEKIFTLNELGKKKALDYITDLTEQEKYTRKDDDE